MSPSAPSNDGKTGGTLTHKKIEGLFTPKKKISITLRKKRENLFELKHSKEKKEELLAIIDDIKQFFTDDELPIVEKNHTLVVDGLINEGDALEILGAPLMILGEAFEPKKRLSFTGYLEDMGIDEDLAQDSMFFSIYADNEEKWLEYKMKKEELSQLHFPYLF